MVWEERKHTDCVPGNKVMLANFWIVSHHSSSYSFFTSTFLSPASFIRLINLTIQSPCICAHCHTRKVSHDAKEKCLVMQEQKPDIACPT